MKSSKKISYGQKEVVTGSTFIANGGELYLHAIKGDISLWDFEIIPFRVHKGF